MRKQLALLFLAVAPALPALAQATPPASPEAGPYEYCNLIGYGLPSRHVQLDYGQDAKLKASSTDADAVYVRHAQAAMVTNAELAALAVEISKLDSPILALNYLARKGWEYVSFSSFSNVNVVYVLRRHARL